MIQFINTFPFQSLDKECSICGNNQNKPRYEVCFSFRRGYFLIDKVIDCKNCNTDLALGTIGFIRRK